MRLKHISPEYTYNVVNGTLSMKEKKAFFGSKLLKFQDSLTIGNESIIYYQDAQNQQINLANEKLLTSFIYNTYDDKLNNSNLVIDNSASNRDNNYTPWVLTINYGKILQNYLFATLKKYRTFEGVTNNNTLNSDVNNAIMTYISDNLLRLYKLSRVDLYITYNDLKSTIRVNPLDGSTPLIQYKNLFTDKIISDENLNTKYTSNTDITKLIDVIKFKQDKSSLDYSFNYYFNLYFEKV